MNRAELEDSVRSCYSTWSATYYDEYYGPNAPYPPMHRDLLRAALREAGVREVLDAGCGPASFLRELAGEGIELYGFDLTPEMVEEGKRVVRALGVPPERIWQGSVLAAESYRRPDGDDAFESAVCIGVLPHVPPEADETVLANLHDAVRPGGLVAVEARNELFALFTLNRFSHRFLLDELVEADSLLERAGSEADALRGALEGLGRYFRLDLPPTRKGKAGEPGYDEILSRAHNPLVLPRLFAAAGFDDVRTLFYHFHALPPMLAAAAPALFGRESLALEDPTDWRGHFMASGFLVLGRRR